jgi:methylated-DNA-[protein]-cysteine S-methyltransferase
MQHAHSIVDTPIGRYAVTATAAGITHIHPEDDPARPITDGHDPAAALHLRAAERALGEYFDGARRGFGDLALAPSGSAFQARVWRELLGIPFGTTASYGGIARRIRRPRAARAVGLANGRNPIAIVVPCHRVIGADGALTGYAGGIERKRWLLEHERGVSPVPLR